MGDKRKNKIENLSSFLVDPLLIFLDMHVCVSRVPLPVERWQPCCCRPQGCCIPVPLGLCSCFLFCHLLLLLLATSLVAFFTVALLAFSVGKSEKFGTATGTKWYVFIRQCCHVIVTSGTEATSTYKISKSSTHK